MKVPFSPQPAGWQIIHADTSLIFDGPNIPTPEPVPLQGERGKSWPPGARFIFLGGTKTSAAFEWLDFRKAKPAEYVGEITGEVNGYQSRLAVFKQEGFPNLFGWHTEGNGVLHFGNASSASRVIELSRATLEGEEIPPHRRAAGRNNGRARNNWPEFHLCNDCWHVQRFDKPDPEACICSKCESPDVDFISARSKSRRAEYDALQAEYGDTANEEPPAPIDP